MLTDYEIISEYELLTDHELLTDCLLTEPFADNKPLLSIAIAY